MFAAAPGGRNPRFAACDSCLLTLAIFAALCIDAAPELIPTGLGPDGVVGEGTGPGRHGLAVLAPQPGEVVAPGDVRVEYAAASRGVVCFTLDPSFGLDELSGDVALPCMAYEPAGDGAAAGPAAGVFLEGVAAGRHWLRVSFHEGDEARGIPQVPSAQVDLDFTAEITAGYTAAGLERGGGAQTATSAAASGVAAPVPAVTGAAAPVVTIVAPARGAAVPGAEGVSVVVHASRDGVLCFAVDPGADAAAAVPCIAYSPSEDGVTEVVCALAVLWCFSYVAPSPCALPVALCVCPVGGRVP